MSPCHWRATMISTLTVLHMGINSELHMPVLLWLVQFPTTIFPLSNSEDMGLIHRDM